MTGHVDAARSRARVAAWKQEILNIRCGWEWAFANGARCAGADNDPRLHAVLKREAELNALIAEHGVGGAAG